MPNIQGIIKALQNIMRKDPGVSGDAQRIEQLGWMITLKILDDKEAELELLHDEYVSMMSAALQWRSWVADGGQGRGSNAHNSGIAGAAAPVVCKERCAADRVEGSDEISSAETVTP